MGEKHQPATGYEYEPHTRRRRAAAPEARGHACREHEREYDVDFKVRSDMELGTLRDRAGLTSIDALVRKAREDQ